MGDIYAAINVGRAYLKDGEYDKSVKLFDYLSTKIGITHDVYYKVLANRAYAFIGAGKFREAVTQLEQVRSIKGGNNFLAWHSIALAYAHFRLGENEKYKEWLEFSRNANGFRGNERFFRGLYPEIKDDLR